MHKVFIFLYFIFGVFFFIYLRLNLEVIKPYLVVHCFCCGVDYFLLGLRRLKKLEGWKCSDQELVQI